MSRSDRALVSAVWEITCVADHYWRSLWIMLTTFSSKYATGKIWRTDPMVPLPQPVFTLHAIRKVFHVLWRHNFKCLLAPCCDPEWNSTSKQIAVTALKLPWLQMFALSPCWAQQTDIFTGLTYSGVVRAVGQVTDMFMTFSVTSGDC